MLFDLILAQIFNVMGDVPLLFSSLIVVVAIVAALARPFLNDL